MSFVEPTQRRTKRVRVAWYAVRALLVSLALSGIIWVAALDSELHHITHSVGTVVEERRGKAAIADARLKRDLDLHRVAVPDGLHDVASDRCHVTNHGTDDWEEAPLPPYSPMARLIGSCPNVQLAVAPPWVQATVETQEIGAGAASTMSFYSRDGATWLSEPAAHGRSPKAAEVSR